MCIRDSINAEYMGTKTKAFNETQCFQAISAQYQINKNSSYIGVCSQCLENCRIGQYYFGGYDLVCLDECSYKYACEYELLDLQSIYKSEICLYGSKMIISIILGIFILIHI
eukprot:TRINITY_DN25842_c0_g1_i1.p2 TRINITY_DN25842_c0_g1~~TRINITY_DN25842_c0_g1_i1.p2  ORF type:complete len:112 (-),score=13.38 TRINITY_DN25842_c0_g1_i1:58-393(-)